MPGEFVDSNVAAALELDCDVFYSEDMQHGQVIEGRVRIVNPFMPRLSLNHSPAQIMAPARRRSR